MKYQGFMQFGSHFGLGPDDDIALEFENGAGKTVIYLCRLRDVTALDQSVIALTAATCAHADGVESPAHVMLLLERLSGISARVKTS